VAEPDPAPSSDERPSAAEPVRPLLAMIEQLEPSWRSQALTHSSWTERRVRSWGRLAFLGDSVLGLALAEHLFTRFPRSDIGRLTKIHGQAVSGRACAEIAVELGVPGMLEETYPSGFDGGLSPSELVESERAMASVVESLLGACYLQFGLARTSEALLAAFAPQVDLASETLLDFKSALQEQLARQGRRVQYEVTDESGPHHDKIFSVQAQVGDEVLGEGRGSSKKAAEQAAAAEALGEPDS
jgi:ribonuclease-3